MLVDNKIAEESWGTQGKLKKATSDEVDIIFSSLYSSQRNSSSATTILSSTYIHG
jgi:hypothetical protein